MLIFISALKTCLKYLLPDAFQNPTIFGMLNLYKGIIQYRDILTSTLLPKLWKLQKQANQIDTLKKPNN